MVFHQVLLCSSITVHFSDGRQVVIRPWLQCWFMLRNQCNSTLNWRVWSVTDFIVVKIKLVGPLSYVYCSWCKIVSGPRPIKFVKMWWNVLLHSVKPAKCKKVWSKWTEVICLLFVVFNQSHGMQTFLFRLLHRYVAYVLWINVCCD